LARYPPTRASYGQSSRSPFRFYSLTGEPKRSNLTKSQQAIAFIGNNACPGFLPGFLPEIVNLIYDLPFPSTQGMSKEDRIAGVKQMLFDLSDLARIDGCVAAAWAIELACVAAQQCNALNHVNQISSIPVIQ
jgi:hypothetical protein